LPSSLSSRSKNRGGRGGSPAAAWADGSGREGGSGVREKREGGERIRSRPWLGPGWSEVARPRGWAAVSGGGRGGAAVELGGGQGEGGK